MSSIQYMLCGNHVQYEAACSVHVDVDDVVETHPYLHLIGVLF
jgi:hypothetical protein